MKIFCRQVQATCENSVVEQDFNGPAGDAYRKLTDHGWQVELTTFVWPDITAQAEFQIIRCEARKGRFHASLEALTPDQAVIHMAEWIISPRRALQS